MSAHTIYSLPEVSEGQINEALTGLVPLRFLPSETFYFTIRAKEMLQRFFQASSAARAQFDLVLCGKRLKESYLLLEQGDVKNSSETLDSYSERLIKMVAQLEKARSQNQDVVPLVDIIAGELEIHETILAAINREWQGQGDSYDFDTNFADAIFGFRKAVSAINNVRPGLKDRYEIPIDDNVNTNVVPYVSPPVTFEASPSVKPKRIIY